jgi:hypothetical protein
LKKFEVGIQAGATIALSKQIRAPNAKKAKEIFLNHLKHFVGVPDNWDVGIVEPPIIEHDFQEKDVEVFEVELDDEDTDVLTQMTEQRDEFEDEVLESEDE